VRAPSKLERPQAPRALLDVIVLLVLLSVVVSLVLLSVVVSLVHG
jgi:hypothetical protein